MSKALKSKYFDEVGTVPRAEYPRPQLQRDSYRCLNGSWDYAILPKKKIFSGYQGKILVPFSPESLLSGVEKTVKPDDVLYYHTEFTVDEDFLNEVTLLHFDAVDYLCKVTLNGTELGTHAGGYIPFQFDVSEIIRPGKNELSLEVTDPSDTGDQARGKQVLAPGGIWYPCQSGIWGPVWMESVSADYISDLEIVPDFDTNYVYITPESTADCVEVTITDPNRDNLVMAEASGKGGERIAIELVGYRPWTPADPRLYDVTLKTSGDTVHSYFGMRKFSVHRDRFGINRLCLNDVTVFHNGVLDQGYWSDGLMTAPTDQAIKDDLQMVKDMGFNMVRKHIKVAPLRYYYYCDKMGILVWQDMVSGGHDYDPAVVAVDPQLRINLKDTKKNYREFRRENPEGREEFLRNVKETVHLLRNCVSLAMWVPFNEGWGQFDSEKVAAMVKKLDPTRTVDPASGWHDQKSGDFRSRHIYFGKVHMPIRDNRCFILSEFGGYSRAVAGHTQAKLPFGYRFYFSKGSIQRAWKRLMEGQIIKNIRPSFLAGGLSASVYTQLSDVEGEVNGLVTYDRKVEKFDREFMREVNRRVKYR
ncbi:MAG: glycoside hydrolase family 2 TIM barrel-domain containing protein [Acutalibacteraceae bacterium]|nr:glycoside hydrolase family 2 TIM barrel-domain containing protein [Acutalibacteraceae bacterium]